MDPNHPTTAIPELHLHVDTPQYGPVEVRSTSLDEVYSILERINTVPAYADRVRVLEINLHYGSSRMHDDIGTRLNTAFPRLRELTSLTLDGCMEDTFNLLDGPIHLPCLNTLKCDFFLSQELERFFAAHPTIVKLHLGGGDSDDLSINRTLPRDILPNLKHIECDTALIQYFVSHRPLLSVMPLPYGRMVIDQAFHRQIFSMTTSTANGGVAAGGGVKKFQLACGYSLQELAGAAPNLQHLYLVEEDNQGPLARFWNTPGWEDGLPYLRSLRKLTVNSGEQMARSEQKALVTRWAAHCADLTQVTFTHRHAARTRVTFSGIPAAHDCAIWSWDDKLGSWDVRLWA